jgi:hypothetical protein
LAAGVGYVAKKVTRRGRKIRRRRKISIDIE